MPRVGRLRLPKSVGRLRCRVGASFLLCVVGFDCFGLFAQAQQPSAAAQSVKGSEAMAPAISIPDGTPVEMRFAQAVRGKMLNPVDVGVEAKQGETVRLVAASNVRIAKKVVIAEGAVA